MDLRLGRGYHKKSTTRGWYSLTTSFDTVLSTSFVGYSKTWWDHAVITCRLSSLTSFRLACFGFRRFRTIRLSLFACENPSLFNER